jgi:hypothetical protein
MRVRKPEYSAQFKPICDTVHDQRVLTGFGGLVLFVKYLWSIGLVKSLRKALKDHRTTGDYGGDSLALLVLLFLVAGGRRMAHLKYFAHDGLLKRLAWLKTMPSKATLSRFFSGFRWALVVALMAINRDVVIGHLLRIGITRQVTLDLDGTVLTSRGKPERAQKGFNPHRRGARSYRPLTLHIAETGQFYAVKNRPGNVSELNGARTFMREHIRSLRSAFPKTRLVVRQDSGFFDDKLLSVYEQEKIGYVCVARMYESLTLVLKERKRWTKINDGISAFEFSFKLDSWDTYRYFVAYRIRLSDKQIANRNGEQLDLFCPTDPEYRYRLYVTNLSREECDTPVLHSFYSGRGGQEKDIGELKSEFAFDVIPSRKYSGNCAWQQLSVLGYKATIGFVNEVVTGEEPVFQTRSIREKATRIFRQIRAKTLRFLHINVPGIVSNNSGHTILRLPESRARRQDWQKFQERLEQVDYQIESIAVES